MTRVRDFVVQQMSAGQRAGTVFLALTFIATELGLQVTHGRNPLGVVRNVLSAVMAAASESRIGQRSLAVPEVERLLSDEGFELQRRKVTIH